MKEYIEFIAKSLVDNPSGVSVEVKSEDEKVYHIHLKVSPEDVGKVIGKQGKIISAIRVLATSVAGREGKRAILEIAD